MKNLALYLLIFNIKIFNAQIKQVFFIGFSTGKDIYIGDKYKSQANTFEYKYLNKQNFNFEVGIMKKSEFCLIVNYTRDFFSYHKTNYLEPNNPISWETVTKINYGFLAYGFNYKLNFKVCTEKFSISPIIDFRINTIYNFAFSETLNGSIIHSYSHNELTLNKESNYISYNFGIRFKYLIIKDWLSAFYIAEYQNYLFQKNDEMNPEIKLKTPLFNNRIGINMHLNKLIKKILITNNKNS